MEKPETLDEVLADMKRRLVRGAKDRRSGFHTPVVVTANVDARIMVLRDFDSETMTCRFHTDARSPKVALIEREPEVALLLYDKAAKVQLRCKGRARIERDSKAAEKAWQKGTNFARRCYLVEPGPSQVTDRPTSGLPAELEGVEPDDGQLIPARENFAILLIELDHIDWLYLAHDGHRRAEWRREGAMAWLTP